jgi:hypothetical protein
MKRLDGTVAFFVSAALKVSTIELILILLGQTPEVATGTHCHKNNTTSPHIYSSGVELLIRVFLGGNIRSRTA